MIHKQFGFTDTVHKNRDLMESLPQSLPEIRSEFLWNRQIQSKNERIINQSTDIGLLFGMKVTSFLRTLVVFSKV